MDGNANHAIVWQRIWFRTSVRSPEAYQRDGHRWWRANRDDMSAETGLSKDQVKRAYLALEAKGYIEGVEHGFGGSSDHTKSYRCVTYQDGRAESPSGRAESPDHDRANSPDLPSLKKKEELPHPPPAAPDSRFEEAWKQWPRKEDKVRAQQAWKSVVKNRLLTDDQLADAVIAHARGHIARGDEKRFVKYLASWLNAKAWLNEVPAPEGPHAGAPRQPAYAGREEYTPPE
ncbi:hypothetical protein HUN59_14710 [Curtobacterium sp. Csp2]|uniref:hypothetical protein n=1 Tax=Curtobacterium sp. Csp2 TaxID=2495430 RepID=UPI001580EF03|nr:hypothetical protein [Curtobacterium sp. Csp2]QKS17292.1 hypothetical protein HUN59_14710 [Curtobacterium sp. Csp2]